MAQSLRSLRPHHSPIPPAQAFRQSWLRCERVKQRVITTGQHASEDSNIEIESIMKNLISTETSSQTAMACEQAALFGTTPGPDEFDNREIWNEDEALAGIEEAIHILAGAVAPDGTQLADERESLLWGFVNALHAQVQRLDRGIDKIAPDMLPRNYVFVNMDAFDTLDAQTRNCLRSASLLAEAAGTTRARELTDWYMAQLRANGMNVLAPGERLAGDLAEIGAAMSAEWSAAAGADGDAIIDAFKAN